MAVSLVVEFANKRHNVRVAPMKTLSAVVEDVCQKLKPRPDPASCELLLKGTKVDLSTPFRFLNIAPNSKLQLQVVGPSGGQQVVAPPEASSRGGGSDLAEMDAGLTSAEVRAGGAQEFHARPAQDLQKLPETESVEKSDRSPEGRHTNAESSRSRPSEPESDPPPGEGWSRLALVGRRFCIFPRLSLTEDVDEEAGNVPDDFYDLTAEDYHRLMKEHQEKVAYREAGLRTRALREFGEQAKAQALGMVHVRLFFPSGQVCQAEFRATDAVSCIYDFAAEIIKGGKGSFVLCTTPPKVDLANDNKTLYQAQLIPSANVHVGPAQPKKKKGKKTGDANLEPGPVELKDQVLACLVDGPPRSKTSQGEGQSNEQSVDPAKTEGKRAVPPGAQPAPKQKKGVPKWMKL